MLRKLERNTEVGKMIEYRLELGAIVHVSEMEKHSALDIEKLRELDVKRKMADTLVDFVLEYSSRMEYKIREEILKKGERMETSVKVKSRVRYSKMIERQIVDLHAKIVESERCFKDNEVHEDDACAERQWLTLSKRKLIEIEKALTVQKRKERVL